MNHEMRGRFRRLAVLVAVACWSAAAQAHTGQGDLTGGFTAGFLHPIGGLDHVMAMVAVGIWSAQLGVPAIWLLPLAFPIVMGFGGLLGGLGMPLPGVEIGVAVSAIALGSMVVLAARPPLRVSAVLVGIFAIFHGHAHGAELPASADPIIYAIGFMVATGSLHALGILIGVANKWGLGGKLLRVAGSLIAACGAYFLVAAVTGA